MSESLADALLNRARSGWTDVWDAGKYAFGPEGYRDLKKNIRYYGGPHLGARVNDVLDILPELMGPGSDVQSMVRGSGDLTRALLNRDATGAVSGGAEMLGGLFGLGVPGSVAMFAGPGAKNANLGALQRAKELKAQGADARRIWDETGWFEGVDDGWRFEIDDSAAFLEHPAGSPKGAEMLRHDVLAEAYDLSNVQQAIRPGDVAKGRYDPEFKTIMAQGPSISDRRSVALHEMSHVVDDLEGFAEGGSPAGMAREFAIKRARINAIENEIGDAPLMRQSELMDDWVSGRISDDEALLQETLLRQQFPALNELDKLTADIAGRSADGFADYRRLAGEVEARNVQTRRDMDMDQRRASPPWETEDVPRDRQIVRFRR